MVRNAWHISGGEGWCSNTTNKRVKTHTDGSQTVEEIQDDLGLKEGDSAGMVERLRRQGVQAASLDTKGGVGAANVVADIAGATLMQAGESPEVGDDSVLMLPAGGDQRAAAPVPQAPQALQRSAPGSRRHSGASDKSNRSAPAHIASPSQAPGMRYAEIAVNAADAKAAAAAAAAAPAQVQSLGDAMRAPVANPSLQVDPSAAGSGVAAVQRRKDGAKAPQYTRQQMEQAAMKAACPCTLSAPLSLRPLPRQVAPEQREQGDLPARDGGQERCRLPAGWQEVQAGGPRVYDDDDKLDTV